MFILPTERAKQAVLDDTLEDGWRIKTSVSPSKVADSAGNGRFAVDDVPRMRVAMLKPHVEMSEVKSLAALPLTQLSRSVRLRILLNSLTWLRTRVI